ncbi:MAG: hypothetical protein R1F54_04695 [Candidatus Zeuxoniibacter abyssi]|nr:MAG: hypothetical protein R1F54_04695 [Candidatus Persebacteraceae bacterium AB1(2)]
MKKTMKIMASCVFMLTLVLFGCVPQTNLQPVTTKNSALTHGNVQLNLKVGETTQAEVLEVFGAPNITTINSSGREVWSYQRAASAQQSASNSNYWTIILAVGESTASGFESSSRMITLIIKFDDKKVISDFRSRVSNF